MLPNTTPGPETPPTGNLDQEEAFTCFFAWAEPRLRRALIARYGVERGREATAEALAWAWQNPSRLDGVRNPVAYLYRVGQSRSRSRRARPVFERAHSSDPLVEPRLAAAVAQLTERQRVSVLLVHGAGWTHAEVAELLGLKAASVQTHVERALDRLRSVLNVEDER